MIQGVLVFLGMSITDVLWTYYIRRTSEGKAFQAALMALALLLLGGMVAISYVENHILLIPAALGSFAGTYFSVKHDAKRVHESTGTEVQEPSPSATSKSQGV